MNARGTIQRKTRPKAAPQSERCPGSRVHPAFLFQRSPGIHARAAPKLQPPRAMAYEPIEYYGLRGNMRTAALVGKHGSIDWYCFPYFDSPSVFAAILDDEKGGRFEIAP